MEEAKCLVIVLRWKVDYISCFTVCFRICAGEIYHIYLFWSCEQIPENRVHIRSWKGTNFLQCWLYMVWVVPEPENRVGNTIKSIPVSVFVASYAMPQWVQIFVVRTFTNRFWSNPSYKGLSWRKNELDDSEQFFCHYTLLLT